MYIAEKTFIIDGIYGKRGEDIQVNDQAVADKLLAGGFIKKVTKKPEKKKDDSKDKK